MHLLLFDLYAGGHHGQYIQLLLDGWATHDDGDRLTVAVPRGFLEVHTEVAPHVARVPGAELHLLERPVVPGASDLRGLLQADRIHGRTLRALIDRLRPDHVLLMYFDQAQLSLATDLRFAYPVRISGIYFRPSFHYPALQGGRAAPREWLTGLRKRLMLRAALRNPHLDTLFCLDPFAAEEVQRWAPAARVVALPDGIEPPPAAATPGAVRQDLGIEAGRRMLLLFGALSRRKGLFEVLDALALLPPETLRQAALVLAGAVDPADRPALQQTLAALGAATPLQLILRDAFLPEGQVQDFVAAADVVLVPYQRHIGSSGVLGRAAAAGVPVVGPRYGLMGALIRQHHLGLAVETTDPKALAAGLATALTEPPEVLFDAAAATRYAAGRTAEAFAGTLLDHLLDPGTKAAP